MGQGFAVAGAAFASPGPEKAIHFRDEFRPGGIVLEDEVVAPVERREPGAGDRPGQIAAGFFLGHPLCYHRQQP